jgi:hypothetical protein
MAANILNIREKKIRIARFFTFTGFERLSSPVLKLREV